MRDDRRHRPQFRDRSVFDGLARRRVDQVDLVAHSVAVLTPSLSALGTGLALPAMVGPGFWVSTLLGFGLAALLALVFDQFASRFNAAGSLYTYVAKGLGTSIALVVGVAMVLGYGALAGFGLTGGARRLEAAWIASGGDEPGEHTGLLLVLLLTAVCLFVIHRGIHWSTRAALATEVVSVSLLVVILALWLIRYGVPGPEVFSLAGASPERIMAGAALIATLTVAFESCASLGLEADRPLRAVPVSMRISLLVAGGLFFAASLVGTVQPTRDSAITWRWFAVGHQVSRLDAAALVILGMSMVALALCVWTALSRLLFSFAREGIVWAGLGLTNPRGVPVVATWCVVPVALAGPLVAWVMGRSASAASWNLLQATTVIMCITYACTALALVPFLRSLDELRPATAALAILALLGVGSVTWRWATGNFSSLAVSLVCGTVVLGLGWRVVLGVLLPRRLRRVGTHEEPLACDVLIPAAPEDHPDRR
ncbi:APC family permease [Nocardioides carbamazepini]|uniref:APC family permease n=1 Tax=Nocardioides carbamazepini TaxID=2854259 RepID=UPI002149E17C|nr:APC family permease [Nocardioides carbamazepini]MCR1785812.1 APC family permease [Nocardioides carbamazepini]